MVSECRKHFFQNLRGLNMKIHVRIIKRTTRRHAARLGRITQDVDRSA